MSIGTLLGWANCSSFAAKYHQIEAGISEPLLERPDIHLPYITPTWLTSLRQFLFNHKHVHHINRRLGKAANTRRRRRVHNVTSATPRIHCNATKQHKPCPHLLTSDDTVGHVPAIWHTYTSKQARRHEGALSTSPTACSGPDRTHLQRVKNDYGADMLLHNSSAMEPHGNGKYKSLPQHLPAYGTESQQEPHRHMTLRSYLKTLPNWQWRMISKFWQKTATDVQVWRAFLRSKRRIIIASDGGLADGYGSFGWKIEDPRTNRTRL
jgi:hypothetical protein